MSVFKFRKQFVKDDILRSHFAINELQITSIRHANVEDINIPSKLMATANIFFAYADTSDLIAVNNTIFVVKTTANLKNDR